MKQVMIIGLIVITLWQVWDYRSKVQMVTVTNDTCQAGQDAMVNFENGKLFTSCESSTMP